jgi:hypothetical protein
MLPCTPSGIEITMRLLLSEIREASIGLVPDTKILKFSTPVPTL